MPPSTKETEGTEPYTTAPSPPAPPGSKSIDQVLAAARSQLKRITMSQAIARFKQNDTPGVIPTVLVDIRPAAQRKAKGDFIDDNVLVIERNVLEWRFDPQSTSRLPIVEKHGYRLRILVMCQEGYTSSLAAVALKELGFELATDVIDGYSAFRKGITIEPVEED